METTVSLVVFNQSQKKTDTHYTVLQNIHVLVSTQAAIFTLYYKLSYLVKEVLSGQTGEPELGSRSPAPT